MKKVHKEMREVEVVDYYAEVGDVIKIRGKYGEFVVEEARMTGGGSAQGSDVYPDAWHVTARKLTNTKYAPAKYTPSGTIIEFTQHTNCYDTMIDGVTQVAKMKKVIDIRFKDYEEIK